MHRIEERKGRRFLQRLIRFAEHYRIERDVTVRRFLSFVCALADWVGANSACTHCPLLLVSPLVRRRRRSLRREEADHPLSAACADKFFASSARQLNAINQRQGRVRLYLRRIADQGEAWEAATIALTAQHLFHQHGSPPLGKCSVYGCAIDFLICGTNECSYRCRWPADAATRSLRR
jgi:hypothetical protein